MRRGHKTWILRLETIVEIHQSRFQTLHPRPKLMHNLVELLELLFGSPILEFQKAQSFLELIDFLVMWIR